MLPLRLPISLMLLAVYVLGAAMGGGPRIYCQETDGQVCLDTVENRCCPTESGPANTSDEGYGSTDVGESSCGQCAGNQVPQSDHQQAPSLKGHENCLAMNCIPVCVICLPADVLCSLNAHTLALPVTPATSRITILRC